MTQKRSIFEEVQTDKPAVGPRPASASAARSRARAQIRGWLIALFALVTVMVAVGGMTRLTESGLSITEWRPVTGAIPPLSAEDWDREFELYRQIDQYALMNRGMSLDEFKIIYWWEWGHRQLGRLIGLVWALGFGFFLLARRIPAGWTPRLLGLGVLGGVQGAIGWWMVASGLTGGMVAVASYRLAVHLGLAFVILGLLAWYILHFSRPEADLMQARRAREGRLAGWAGALVALALVQIVLGALVAGLRAGAGFTDWPLMNGALIPAGILALDPLWTNLFENPATAQFAHRKAGYLLALVGLVVWQLGRRSPHPATRIACSLMTVVLLAQIGLGVATVMLAAPWELAIAHQATAILLWVMILRARHLALYPRAARLTA